MFSFTLILFPILNITASCKYKIAPSSEFEMISEELESLHINSFCVDPDVFKIICQIPNIAIYHLEGIQHKGQSLKDFIN